MAKQKEQLTQSNNKEIKDDIKILKTMWRNMKYRCYNHKSTRYKTYGLRGIKIEWESFDCFFDDMYDKYKEAKKSGMKCISIDRIDNDGNYSFKNCRFIELSLNSYLRHKNIPKTEEFKLKISYLLTGIKRSEETKNKMSIERKGKKQTENRNAQIKKLHDCNKLKVFKIDINTKEILATYNSVKEASAENNIISTSISKCINKKIKNAGGFSWEKA